MSIQQMEREYGIEVRHIGYYWIRIIFPDKTYKDVTSDDEVERAYHDWLDSILTNHRG